MPLFLRDRQQVRQPRLTQGRGRPASLTRFTTPLPLEPHGFDGDGPLARGGLQGGWTDVFPLRFFSITLVSSLLH